MILQFSYVMLQERIIFYTMPCCVYHGHSSEVGLRVLMGCEHLHCGICTGAFQFPFHESIDLPLSYVVDGRPALPSHMPGFITIPQYNTNNTIHFCLFGAQDLIAICPVEYSQSSCVYLYRVIQFSNSFQVSFSLIQF